MIDKQQKTRSRGIAATVAFNRILANERFLSVPYADAASNGPDFEVHFAGARPGSANALLTSSERSIVRNRVRRELVSNSYLRGIVDAHVYSVIGRSPRLRILNDQAGMTENQAREVGLFFRAWSKKSRFGEICRQIYEARKVDGEDLSIIRTNRSLFFPVKMQVRRLDCDQLMSKPGEPQFDEEREVDGVVLEDGDVVSYRFLRRHPRGIGLSGLTDDDFMMVPELYVIHHFREFRVGQRRGMSELAPCLLPGASMRRYTMAVVKCAETAAALSAMLHTDEINDDDGSPMLDPFVRMPIHHNTAMALPDGYRVTQLKAEQPVDTYKQFKREMVGEAGRGIGVSANTAMGDSSESSYSSARFDRLGEDAIASIERHDFAEDVISRVMFHFGMESTMADSGLPIRIRDIIGKSVMNMGEFPAFDILWDQPGTIDEQKRSNSYDTDIRNRSRTIGRILEQRDGGTIEEHVAELKREMRLFTEAGIPYPGDSNAAMNSQSSSDEDQDSSEDGK